MKFHLPLALAAGMFATSVIAEPAPHTLSDFPRRIATKQEAMECCLSGAKVALACKDCKTLNAKNGPQKASILVWFASDSKRDCSGCGGKITVKSTIGGKGPNISQKRHTCSKCGNNSSYICTDHKKA